MRIPSTIFKSMILPSLFHKNYLLQRLRVICRIWRHDINGTKFVAINALHVRCVCTSNLGVSMRMSTCVFGTDSSCFFMIHAVIPLNILWENNALIEGLLKKFLNSIKSVVALHSTYNVCIKIWYAIKPKNQNRIRCCILTT